MDRMEESKERERERNDTHNDRVERKGERIMNVSLTGIRSWVPILGSPERKRERERHIQEQEQRK